MLVKISTMEKVSNMIEKVTHLRIYCDLCGWRVVLLEPTRREAEKHFHITYLKDEDGTEIPGRTICYPCTEKNRNAEGAR